MKTTLLWLLPLLPPSVPGDPRAPQATIEPKVDAIFAPWDSTRSPGCALAVIQKGAIVFSRGYGMANLEHGIAISGSTVFYVGSVSKQFVAASIALLAEEGRLSLDNDIRRYVPEISDYGHPITIRHLIHHTSGLRDYLELMELSGRSYADFISQEEVLLDIISRQKALNFAPGEKHLYSNSGYFLLAVIVERVTGTTLREFAQARIFEPTGMHDSHFHDDYSMLIPNRAEEHVAKKDGSWGLTRSRFSLAGSGGLFTTVRDLFLWDQNFYNNRLGQGGPDLIRTLLTPGKLANGDDLDYAFGLTVGTYRGLPIVRHGGALGGYRAHILRFPEERFTVALTCNLDTIDPDSLVEQVADLYLAGKLGPKPEAKAEAEAPTPKPEEVLPLQPRYLVEYAGEYASDELLVTYRISAEEGELVLRVRRNPKTKLRLTAEDVLAHGGVRMEFERDHDKQISGFILDSGRVRNLRFVKQ